MGMMVFVERFGGAVAPLLKVLKILDLSFNGLYSPHQDAISETETE
jgi:hypothetical protein